MNLLNKGTVVVFNKSYKEIDATTHIEDIGVGIVLKSYESNYDTSYHGTPHYTIITQILGAEYLIYENAEYVNTEWCIHIENYLRGIQGKKLTLVQSYAQQFNELKNKVVVLSDIQAALEGVEKLNACTQ